MKKFMLIFSMCFTVFSFSTFAQIKVISSGNVGINNTSPTYKLDVAGNFRVVDGSTSLTYAYTDFYPTGNMNLGTYNYKWNYLYSTYALFVYSPIIISDLNYKSNISDLGLVKDKIKLLRPIYYTLDADKLNLNNDNGKKPNDKQIGFIAQEVKEVFPDIVRENEKGMLGIQYTELIPVLVQAIKEQQEEIDALNKRITDLENNKK